MSNRTFIACLAALLALAVASPVAGRSSGTTRTGPGMSSGSPPKADPGVKLDTRGHIGRAVQAKDEFRKAHPCPATGKISGPCPGFVVEHIVPLSRGGADRPANMQWQAVAVTKPRG